jgi:hypothetical protein
LVGRLQTIRCQFGTDVAVEKLQLLERLAKRNIPQASDLKRFHACLSFIRAFPDTAELLAHTQSELHDFQRRVERLAAGQKSRLAESGIAGTELRYPFSYDVASWMARHFAGVATIDWSALPDTDRLDELLDRLLEHAESDYFHGGNVSTEEWLGIASRGFDGTDFDWLMTQLAERGEHEVFWRGLYDAVDLPLKCELRNDLFSRTGNALRGFACHFRNDRMRNRMPFAKREIVRPLEAITLLEPAQGNRVLDAARSSLALRHRETDHFNNANPAEIYLADVGKGICIALMGLLPERRDPLECTMGYLILSNGVPIGYGGASLLFHQANTGINVFDEYRGSEAAWLWTQVMRVVHLQAGCTRFIANPYQFGEENPEALKSGAFWFYYRLGFRPVDAEVRALAAREFRKISAQKVYRSPVSLLKQLATCDMHLELPGARRSQFFDERWIEECARLATSALAAAGQPSRKGALNAIVSKLMKALGLQSLQHWPELEQAAFTRFAPMLAEVDVASWPQRERRALVGLLRAKGGRFEIDYARRLRMHSTIFTGLKQQAKGAGVQVSRTISSV